MDYWRSKYLLPAIHDKQRIALIGIGDNPAYWESHSLTSVAAIWDPARLAVSGTEYRVYDIDANLVERARQAGINATCCDVTREQLGHSFDIIFASDVIEHVHDPFSFFSNCRKSLTQGGQLVITTPNALYWRNFFFGYRHEHPEHLCCFAAAHIKNIANRTGFSTCECHSFQATGATRGIRNFLRPIHRLFASLGRGNSLVACLTA